MLSFDYYEVCPFLSFYYFTYIFPYFLGNVASEYKEFSEWYLKTFSQAILTSILRVLVVYQSGVYVSPRVMQLALNYVNTGVSHALTWKLIKPHILVSL